MLSVIIYICGMVTILVGAIIIIALIVLHYKGHRIFALENQKLKDQEGQDHNVTQFTANGNLQFQFQLPPVPFKKNILFGGRIYRGIFLGEMALTSIRPDLSVKMPDSLTEDRDQTKDSKI